MFYWLVNLLVHLIFSQNSVCESFLEITPHISSNINNFVTTGSPFLLSSMSSSTIASSLAMKRSILKPNFLAAYASSSANILCFFVTILEISWSLSNKFVFSTRFRFFLVLCKSFLSFLFSGSSTLLAFGSGAYFAICGL